MKNGFLLSIFILSTCSGLFAETFIRRYPVNGQFCGFGSAVSQQDAVGITGFGSSLRGPTETILGRLQSDGTLSFFRTFSSGRFLVSLSVGAAPKGGFVVAANNFDEIRNADNILLFRTTPEGGIRWGKTITSGTNEDVYAMTAVPGGYVLGGATGDRATQDLLVMKINLAGKVLWSRAIGDSDFEFTLSVAAFPDGGFIAAGEKGSDPFVARFDSNGNLIWMKLLTSAPFSSDSTVKVATLTDGSFVIGVTLEPSNNSSIFLARLDANGDRIWSKKYASSSAVVLFELASTLDGGVLVSGQLGFNDPKPLIFKVRANGSIQWKKTYTEFSGSARTAVELSDGSVLVSGCVQTPGQELFAMKLNEKGTLGSACSRLKNAGVRTGSQSFQLQDLSLPTRTPQFSISKPALVLASPETTETNVCSEN
jgi:hypothetical protein